MVLHFGIAVVAVCSPPVLAPRAGTVDVVVVVVYAAGVVVALWAAVRGVHLLRFIHGGGPRRRRPRGRRKSSQFLTRLDRDSCCRHSIHWRMREFFARSPLAR